jgi:hypothetical protein
MTVEADTLGRCTECAKTYIVYKQGKDWRASCTDGTGQCGNGEFSVLSAKE